jgi:hypothetical protein
VHKIEERDGQVVVRRLMNLSTDHRLADRWE